MKAYIVWYNGQEWCDFTHASSARQARKDFFKEWAGEGEYIDTRARRVPALDDKPLTGKNITEFYSLENDDWLDGHTDTCLCPLCKPKIHLPGCVL